MDYKYLKARGALNEASIDLESRPARSQGDLKDLATRMIPPAVLALLPQSVARENLVIPLAFDGETLIRRRFPDAQERNREDEGHE